jgi:hypothetical protein
LVADVTAEQYLRYAVSALEDGSDRGSIDAFGHAKRALHLTVEFILNAYGLRAEQASAAGPSRVYDHEGTEVRLLNPVRRRDGSLLPGIEIDERPVWTFSLRYQDREKWGPLLAPLVQLSASRSGHESARF